MASGDGSYTYKDKRNYWVQGFARCNSNKCCGVVVGGVVVPVVKRLDQLDYCSDSISPVEDLKTIKVNDDSKAVDSAWYI